MNRDGSKQPVGTRSGTRAVHLVAIGAARFARSFVPGILACLNPVTALVAIGWTARLGRRVAQRAMVNRGLDDGAGREPLEWPRWIRAEPARGSYGQPGSTGGAGKSSGPLHDLEAGAARPLGGLVVNLRVGWAIAFNTFVVLMPAAVFMAFSWHAGWDNSFHKGYEQYWAGPVTGLVGIALLVAAMRHVPIAQARQAACGRPSAFFNLRKVSEVAGRRPIQVLLLALAHVVGGLGFVAGSVGLAIAPAIWPGLEALDPDEVRWLARLGAASAALVAFPLYVALKVWAAQIHAVAAQEAVLDGTWPDGDASFAGPDAPAANVAAGIAPRWHARGGRAARWARFGVRRVAGALTIAAWLAFAAELYVSQFFVARPVARWANPPLVNLPWLGGLPRGGASDRPDRPDPVDLGTASAQPAQTEGPGS